MRVDEGETRVEGEKQKGRRREATHYTDALRCPSADPEGDTASVPQRASV
jgi:hypothetical protein